MYKKLDFQVTGATGAATTVYITAPCRCIITNVMASCDADPGDAETITFSSGATAVGVLTYGSTIAAGAVGTYAADATNGQTIFAEGAAIKIVVTQLTAAATFRGSIELDPYARVDQ